MIFVRRKCPKNKVLDLFDILLFWNAAELLLYLLAVLIRSLGLILIRLLVKFLIAANGSFQLEKLVRDEVKIF